jgi:hypothetical protein
MNSNRRKVFYGAVVPLGLAIVSALLVIAFPQPAAAFCSSTSQCPSHQVCQDSLIPGMKECRMKACNSDADCPTERPNCAMGICQAPVGGTGGTSGGISLGDVGQTCGPYKIGQVTKQRGCKKGLQCVKGKCQKPLQ